MLSIKNRQKNLQWLGFYKGKIDGKWGNSSKQATKEFQKFAKITVDAIYGKNTDKKLIEVVKTYQKKLGANADGIAGTNTIKKTKTYQKSKGLTQDGICGYTTRAKLNGTKVPKSAITYETPVNWNTIKFFKKSEVACPKRCNGYPTTMKQKCMNVADRARGYFGKPATISSALRCQKHNDSLSGSVKNSYHTKGKAIDFSIQGVSGRTLYNYLKKQPEVKYTYIITGSWVHFNTY